MNKLIFLAGAAAGYVLGTRAGRERYQQISDGARRLGDSPAVRQAQTKLKDLGTKGQDTVAAKLDDAASTESRPSATMPSAV